MFCLINLLGNIDFHLSCLVNDLAILSEYGVIKFISEKHDNYSYDKNRK